MCIEQYDHIELFLQDILHTSHLPNTQYRKSLVGGVDSVVQVSYLQLTWPNGWAARNFAALVFRPEV
jgi:hypothetical protein